MASSATDPSPIASRISFSESVKSLSSTRIGLSDLVIFGCGCMFLLCAVFNEYAVSCYISAVGIVVFLVAVFLRHNTVFFKYIFLIFSLSSYILGIFLCETSDRYLDEMAAWCQLNGSLPSYAVYVWIFVMTLVAIDPIFTRLTRSDQITKGSAASGPAYKYGPYIIFIVGAVLCALIFKTSSFSLGINRFEYASEYLPSGASLLQSILLLSAPLILYPLLVDGSTSWWKKIVRLVVVYLPFVLFAFWIGNKFGLFWKLAWSFLLPLTAYFMVKKVSLSKKLKVIVGGIAILASIVIAFQVLRGNTGDALVERLVWRFAAQGELWWQSFSFVDSYGTDFSILATDIEAIGRSIATGGGVKEYGVYHLMAMFGSPNIVSRYLAIDMRYSAQGLEILYLGIGYLAFIVIPLIMGTLFSLLVNLYVADTNHGHFVSAMVYLKLLTTTMQAFMQGDWYSLFSSFSLLMIAILIFALLYRAGKRSKSIDRLKQRSVGSGV